MARIFRYLKQSDEHTTYQPLGDGIIELCTLDDGYTYVSVSDDSTLTAEQPEQVQLEEITLTDQLKEKIKAASPHCQLIYARMQERIKAAYCDEDEKYLTRIAVGQLAGWYTMQPGEPEQIAAFQVFIEGVRQWGRDERAKLGL